MVENVEIYNEALENYKERTGDDAPSLSVIIPVYDDPDGIEITVESLLATTYPNLEVLVVMTPSTGETRAVLDDFAAEDDRISVLIEDDYQTPGAARNVGLEATGSDLVVFTDSDMAVEPALPWKIAHVFDESDVDYLGFPVKLQRADDENVFGWYDRNIRFANEFFMDTFGFCPTCALAIRDSIVDEGLRFNPDIVSAEDMLFGTNVDEAGFSFGYCPDVRVEHPARNSFGAIVTKGKKTGQGWHEVHSDDSSPLFPRSPLVEHLAFLPDPPWFMEGVCDDWDSRPRREQSLLFLVSYVENLAKFWGYTEAVVTD